MKRGEASLPCSLASTACCASSSQNAEASPFVEMTPAQACKTLSTSYSTVWDVWVLLCTHEHDIICLCQACTVYLVTYLLVQPLAQKALAQLACVSQLGAGEFA